MIKVCPQHSDTALAHQALFYRNDGEYAQGVLQFIQPGLDEGEPIAFAVPAARAQMLRERVAEIDDEIELLDMVELGRNPARIIPAVQAMLEKHGGRQLHYVGEPIWPGRTREEINEATRHEALINLAWPDASLRVLCPYDAMGLDDDVLVAAEQTHPQVIRAGELRESSAYSGPTVPLSCDDPLSGAPASAVTLGFDLEDLAEVRKLVGEHATASGLASERVADLVLAVNEIATNSVRHAQASGTLSLWRPHGEIVCQVEDSGHIVDPLAGRRAPVAEVAGGVGLWMVNQLCDLVEVRTTAAGTVIRVHMNAA